MSQVPVPIIGSTTATMRVLPPELDVKQQTETVIAPDGTPGLNLEIEQTELLPALLEALRTPIRGKKQYRKHP